MKDLSNNPNRECNNLPQWPIPQEGLPQWPISPERLESIIQLHTNVIGILKKGLCSKKLVKRIIKEFDRNDERQSILEDINSHNLKLDEAKYKFFKSIYKSQAMKNVFWQDRHYFIYQLLTTEKTLVQIEEFLPTLETYEGNKYHNFTEFLWDRFPQK